MPLLLFALLPSLAALAGCSVTRTANPAPRTAPADASDAVLFARGRLITDPARPARELTLLVRGGRVERVDADAAFAAERAGGAKEIPLDGLTVVPGLTDAHAHLYELGEAREWVNLLGASKEEALERVRQKVAERKGIATGPVREWIQGRGWTRTSGPGRPFRGRRSSTPSNRCSRSS